MTRPRWDIDERGRGVTDAVRFSPDIHALSAAMHEPDWIAEDPEAHLLPHLERAIAASNGEWRILETHNDDGLLELVLAWTPGKGADSGRPKASLRASAFGLIGTVAESASLVRQRVSPRETVFDVTTGMLDGDGPFGPHGHLLRLRVRLPSSSDVLA
jgi:hypothetical protein